MQNLVAQCVNIGQCNGLKNFGGIGSRPLWLLNTDTKTYALDVLPCRIWSLYVKRCGRKQRVLKHLEALGPAFLG